MKSENNIPKNQLIAIGKWSLHSGSQVLTVVAGPVRTAQVFNEDGRVVLTDSRVSTRDRTRRVGIGEINLRIDPFSWAGSANEITVVSEGKFGPAGPDEPTKR